MGPPPSRAETSGRGIHRLELSTSPSPGGRCMHLRLRVGQGRGGIRHTGMQWESRPLVHADRLLGTCLPDVLSSALHRPILITTSS